MTTRTMTTVEQLDREIEAAQATLDAAQRRWQHRPRGQAQFGEGPIRIDHQLKVSQLDLGLAVDEAIIAIETLKQAKSESRLTEILADRAEVENAVQVAQQAADDADAVAREARRVAHGVRTRLDDNRDRERMFREEAARAALAIRNAQQAREREQAEREQSARIAGLPPLALAG